MMTLEPKVKLTALGGWNLFISDQLSTAKPRQKVTALFVYLLLESTQTHSRELLAGLLWPDKSYHEGRNNLRVTLSQLKKLIGDPNFLETSRIEVGVNPATPFVFDVLEFEALIGEIEHHNHEALNACSQCMQNLQTAVELYKGPFLPGFILDGCDAFNEWKYVWDQRLQVMINKQLDNLSKAMLASGQYNQAQTYAQRQIALDSLSESGHQNLMRALYAAGQRSLALQQYHQCVELLEKELGVTPEPQTEKLYQQISQNTLHILIAKPEPKPESSSRPAVSSLPKNLTPFFGRESEIKLISDRLMNKSSSLISIVGPGGIGKTRLAIQAATHHQDQFQDGAYFAPLAGVQSAADIPAAISEAIGIPLSGPGNKQEQLINILSNKEMLIVVDNLEHLIDDSIPVIQSILETAQGIILIVTSRERFNLSYEDLFRLKGLPYPSQVDDLSAAKYAAVRLFGDRAHRLNKRFWLNEDTLPYVVHICQLVEGLPLGLELAATWVRDFSAEAIADAIEEDLELLHSDFRDFDPRHRNIQALFDYSWRLLSPQEQEILPLLTLFKGSFTGRAAKTIMNASPLIIKRLMYKSLVRSERNGRYTMHELLRQMAARKRPSNSDPIKRSYFRYYLELLRINQNALRTLKAKEAAQIITADIDNIRQAWQWALQAEEFDLLTETAPALADYYTHTGYFFEGQSLIEQVIKKLPPTEKDKRLQLLIAVAYILSELNQGTFTELKATTDEIFKLAPNHADYPEITARAFLYLSNAYFVHSIDIEEAQSHIEHAFEIAEGLNNPLLFGDLYVQLGCNHYRIEETEKAISFIQKALDTFEEYGDIKRQAAGINALAVAYSESGNTADTFRLEQKLLGIYQEMGSEYNTADQNFNLSMSYGDFGAFNKSLPLTMKSLDVFQKYNDQAAIQNCYISLGYEYYMLGDVERSLSYYKLGIDMQEELQLTSRLCNDLTEYSFPLRKAGRLDEAEAALRQAIQVRVAPRYLTQAEVHLACVLFDKGQTTAALELTERLWDHIKADEAKSLPDVLSTLANLHYVFVASQQSQKADEVAQLARREIKATAESIDDPELLQTFLSNQPYVVYFDPKFAPSSK